MLKLLQKESKWSWTDECQDAFVQLKERLVTLPTLRMFDLNKEFILYTDASGYALGAILAQKDESNVEYVVGYASRILKNAELNYGITEK